MKRLGLGLSLLLAGCAASPPSPGRATRSTTTARVPAARRFEQASALFDAAAHNDRARLKLLVDWPRYRLLAAWQRAHADHEVSTAELSLIEGQPETSEDYVNLAAGELQAQLAEVAKGPVPPRPLAGVANALFGELKRGAPLTKYPSLPRLWELTADAIAGAEELTYSGARGVTLLFVGERLAGTLPAR